MIELEILQIKKLFKKTNGDEVIDLTRRSVSFNGVREGQGRTYVVEEEAVMRVDLIAKIAYQTRSFLCLLLKYNLISNPFSIDLNDTLKIPDSTVLSSLKKEAVNINGSNENWTTATRKKKRVSFITPKTKQDKNRLDYLQQVSGTQVVLPKTKQDKNRLDYLQQVSGTQVVPPNVAKDTSVKVVGGKIVFGTDVTSVKKEDCPDPISRTKLQAALLKNKIFG
jgi:hypothetical protein